MPFRVREGNLSRLFWVAGVCDWTDWKANVSVGCLPSPRLRGLAERM